METADFEKSRLDKLIRRRFGKHIPQSFIEKAIRNGDVLLDGKKTKASAQVSDDCENVYINESLFTNFKADDSNSSHNRCDEFKEMIIYEDDNLIIINKPAGIAVQLGTGMKKSIDVMAKSYNPEARLVHRIDKETSGVTILSKNLKTSRYMLELFKNKMVQKRYMAIVSGANLKDKGTIDIPISRRKDIVVVDKNEGKEAITEYRTILSSISKGAENSTIKKEKKLEKSSQGPSLLGFSSIDQNWDKRSVPNFIDYKEKKQEGLALVDVYPRTGRTHQIRVHMKYIGCPILGDRKYGGREFKRLCLHAYKVSFTDIEGKKIKITAPLPEYMS